ncbi:MAG: MATE family efflux transporter [Gorillibacterium sp.]|nr:MATE family efflux transporter [Gorillibacterium sp.]
MLAWPIFIEVFLQTLLGTVDTIMVSRISDDAVAVVGISNQIFGALTTLFMTFAGGAGILVAQRIGSKRGEEARTIAIMGVSISTLIGIFLSIILFSFPEGIAHLLNVPDELIPLSNIYIGYVGGGMFMVAMMSAMSTAIRNTGNTKGPMYMGIMMNVLHIILNYIFIFGSFGFPKLGLGGVAVSDNVCRLLAVLVLFYMFRYSFERKILFAEFKVFNRKLFKEILKIGWPLGVNMACWVFSQLAIFSFLALLGPKELATRTYMNTLESFCFTLGYAFALSAQIQIAHLFGAKRINEAYKSAYRALIIGLIIVTANAFLIFLFGKYLLGIFTSDPDIIAMGVSLLALNLILQPCKMLNMAMGNSLNAVGDTKYVMYISIVSLSLIATGCSYWIGIEVGWGLIGIYCCMIADEMVRGLLVLNRWRGRKMLHKMEAEELAVGSPILVAGTGTLPM